MRALKFLKASSRWAVTTVAALGVGAAVVVIAGSAAAGRTTVTYSASVTLPAQPSSNFAGAGGGGDGWAVALSATKVYNVFHHSGELTVECHLQSDASVCSDYP